MYCRAATAIVFAMVFSACGGGGGNGDNGETTTGPKAGETCETDKATACGESFSGDEAVLICIVSGTEGAMTWNEQDTCKKHQNCVDDKSCEVDCDSAFVCDGRECGDDGCGGSCGACPTGFSCNGGECQEFVCDPICGDAECGPNGCGETCGDCTGDLVCVFPAFTCEPKPEGCIPDCLDKNCGPNGCGGSCGVCSTGFCSQETLTCTSPCVPDCTGKDCGDDGCGGSCGGCVTDGEFCNPETGTCGPCDPITNTMCPPDQYCTYASGGTSPVCEVAGEQGYGDPCGGTDSCKEGICISIGEGSAMCFQICKLHEDCGEGNQCIELMDSPYKVCSGGGATVEDCDLLKQECKLETEACYFDGTAMKPVCQPVGANELGAACSGVPNDCVPGLMCISDPSGGGYKCFQLCNTDKGEEPSCDPDSDQPNCANYYAKQGAGYCND